MEMTKQENEREKTKRDVEGKKERRQREEG
jgi:hypothetical protein